MPATEMQIKIITFVSLFPGKVAHTLPQSSQNTRKKLKFLLRNLLKIIL